MDIDMQTIRKTHAAALAVFSSRSVTRRACGGRSMNGGVFAPPFTLPIHMDCGPMPWDGLHPRVWPPLSGSALSPSQDGEGWSFTFGPEHCTGCNRILKV